MADDEIIDMKKNVVASHFMEDDELAGLPITKRPRVTPRSSIAAQDPKQTPHANLRALASLIRRPSTPEQRRASSVGTAFPSGKNPSTTPIFQPRTTPRVRRPLQPVGPSISNPTTPHTIRALRHRRATPGQDRRRSGRARRETPRDTLRNLSKILATTSQPVRPSPLSVPRGGILIKQQEQDEFQDELSPEQPGFTIAIDNDEEDESSLIDRPRLSMPLDEAEETAKSVEVPRRVSARDEQGLYRASLGSLQMSDRFGAPRESNVGDSYGDPADEQQWQDAEDKDRNFTAERDPGVDLRRYIHETSEQPDELSSGHLEPSLQAGIFSPFVLAIPDNKPKDQALHSQAFDNLPDDDIMQFGTPLPASDVPPSRFLKPIAVQRPSAKPVLKSVAKARARKALKVSRHGVSYRSLPVGITKSIATVFARSMGKKKARLSKDTMNAILEAGEQFFEQLGGDLAVVASHAGRKTIDDSDMIAIMQRQRQISLRATAFSLASRYLPGETLKEVRMPILKLGRPRKKPSLEDIAEDIGEEDV